MCVLLCQRNSLRGNASSDSGKAAKDNKLARRLLSIALTNFLCWFPVGLLGESPQQDQNI
jgi:hypothetical protein